MWYWHLLFFFVAFGSKLVLALVTIYLLLPAETSCSDCDGETLLLRMGRVGRTASRLAGGRLQRRWCPRCGWEGTVRAPRGRGLSPAPLHPGTPAR